MNIGKTRTQKAMLNTVTSAASEVISMACRLILPRLILATFGSAYNGISSSAGQFLSSVSILTVGITGSTRFALYGSLANHDLQKTSGIVRATELFMRKIGYVLLLLVVVLTAFYPLLIDTEYSWIEVAPLIIAAGISAAGQYFFGTTYKSLLMADQSIYVSNILHTIANVLNVLVSVVLIYTGCSIQVVKIVSSLVLALNPVILAIYVRRKYSLDRKCAPDYSAHTMRRDVMAHAIANIVHDHTDIIVLTIFCNVKIVSVYTIYNLVMVALKMTQMVFTNGTEAIFGNMWVKKEFEKIRHNLRLLECIVGVYVSVVFSTALVMILPFISLYTKDVTDVEYILPAYAVVIIAAQMFFAFRTPYLSLIQGAGHYKETKKGAYTEAIINLVTSIVLVQFFGIVGVAIGTLLANLFRTVQFAVYLDNHVISRGKMVFIRRILWSVANVVVISAVAEYIIGQNAYAGWMAWVMYAMIVTAFSVVITLLSMLVFYRKDLIDVFGLMKRALRSKLH